MNEKVENLLLEHLQSICSDMSVMKDDMRGMRSEMLALKQHMAAFMSHETTQDGDIASIKVRLDRIEKRLELADGE